MKIKLRKTKDEFDRTLLHVCHPDCLDFLLEYAFKTNQLTTLSKIQDTHKFVPFFFTEIIKNFRKLVLHIFAERGYNSALQSLLSKIGAENIDFVDNLSMSPLLLACNKVEKIEFLC